jgi:hypothetical protein
MLSNRGSSHKVEDMSSIRLGNFAGTNKSNSPNPGGKFSKKMSKTSFQSMMQSADKKRERAGTLVSQSPNNVLSAKTPTRAGESPANNMRFSMDAGSMVFNKVIEKTYSIPLSQRNSAKRKESLTLEELNGELLEPDSALPFKKTPLNQEELMAEISEQSREEASPNVRSRAKGKHTVTFEIPPTFE